MPKYAKGTAGKLIVQDWNVLTSYPDRQVFRILTEPQIAALVSLCEFLSWRTRYLNFPGQDVISAFAAETVYNLTTPIDFCELIEPCLAGLYDAIAAVQGDVTNIQNIVEAIQQTQLDNSAQPVELAQTDIPDEICGAATALVEAMDGANRKTFEDTENSLIDSVFEFIPQFIEAVPLFGSLPFDELFELANAYFENQYTVYKDDFALIKDQLVCDLSCFVTANGDEFTWDVWNEWLVYVGEGTLEPDSPYFENAAAEIFRRYAPVYNTFANQIAAIFNRDSSLQQYFDTLALVWQQGMLVPVSCADCDCPEEYVWSNVGILGSCGAGAKSTGGFDIGVPFDVTAYQDDTYPTYYIVALMLPAGNWNITLNSIVGTITPPADLNESAYAWIDLTGNINPVTWNTPATPADFGSHDTLRAEFPTWCSGQQFNAFLSNNAPFVANFTVTPA